MFVRLLGLYSGKQISRNAKHEDVDTSKSFVGFFIGLVISAEQSKFSQELSSGICIICLFASRRRSEKSHFLVATNVCRVDRCCSIDWLLQVT